MSKEFNAMSMRGFPVSIDCSLHDGVDPLRVTSRCKQSFRDDANINTILKRYQKTGMYHEPGKVRAPRQAQFGDFSDLYDLAETLKRSNEANARFMALPATTRAKFENNVSNLLDFIHDPKNLEEAINLKLIPESMRSEESKERIAKAKAQAEQAARSANLANDHINDDKGLPKSGKPAASGS